MLDPKKYGIRKVFLGYLIIIIATLIVSLASVFVFTFTLTPKLGGIFPALIFLVIPLLYLLVAICTFKKTKNIYSLLDNEKQFFIDLINQILVYIIIMLMMFFIFLITLYIPFDKRGTNEIPLNLTIQPYLLNISENNYSRINFNETREVYSEYNLILTFEEPKIIDKKIDEGYKQLIFNQNCSIIDELYNFTDKSDKKVKLILLDYNGSIDGMGYFCEKSDLIIMSTNTTIPGWVLAHEIGHVLGAQIRCWKYNLMKEYSNDKCYSPQWVTHDFIRQMQPDFLDQEQVDSIVRSIKNRF